MGPGSRFGATGEGNPELMGVHNLWLEDEVLAVSGMSLLCQGLLAPLRCSVARGGQNWDPEQSPGDLRPKDNVGNGLPEATFDASDLNENINKNEL